jgi:hypothetical protein
MAIKVNAPNKASFPLYPLLWRRQIADSGENKRTQPKQYPNAACVIIDDSDYSALNAAPSGFVITTTQRGSNREMLLRLFAREARYIGLMTGKGRISPVISYLWEPGFDQRAVERALAPQKQPEVMETRLDLLRRHHSLHLRSPTTRQNRKDEERC